MVTGGAGFIGTNLIKGLLKDGHEVVSLDNYSTGTEENHQEGCTYHSVDVRDAFDFDFFMKDLMLFIIWRKLPRIQPSFDYPAVTFEINALGTMNILEWARTKNCKVVYAGSSSHHNGIYENPYTFSKDIGEQLCEMYYRVYGVETRICRFYNVYGDSQLTEGEYTDSCWYLFRTIQTQQTTHDYRRRNKEEILHTLMILLRVCFYQCQKSSELMN